MDSGRGITSGGSGFAAILAHAEGALYGTELGSVTFKLKRIGFFCFPIKHSTHTQIEPQWRKKLTVTEQGGAGFSGRRADDALERLSFDLNY
jgi:hypothetical protein